MENTATSLCVYAANVEMLRKKHCAILVGFTETYHLRKTDIACASLNVFMDKVQDVDTTLTTIYSNNRKIKPRAWHAEFLKLTHSLRADKIKTLKPLEDKIIPKLPRGLETAWNDHSLIDAVTNVMKVFHVDFDKVASGDVDPVLSQTVETIIANTATFVEAEAKRHPSSAVDDIISNSKDDVITTILKIKDYCAEKNVSLRDILYTVKNKKYYNIISDIIKASHNDMKHFSCSWNLDDINMAISSKIDRRS